MGHFFDPAVAVAAAFARLAPFLTNHSRAGSDSSLRFRFWNLRPMTNGERVTMAAAPISAAPPQT